MRLLFWPGRRHHRHVPAGMPCTCPAEMKGRKRRNHAEENAFCNHVYGSFFGQRVVSAPTADGLCLIGRMRKRLQPCGPLCKTVLLLSCFWGNLCDRSSAGGALTLFSVGLADSLKR